HVTGVQTCALPICLQRRQLIGRHLDQAFDRPARQSPVALSIRTDVALRLGKELDHRVTQPVRRPLGDAEPLANIVERDSYGRAAHGEGKPKDLDSILLSHTKIMTLAGDWMQQSRENMPSSSFTGSKAATLIRS